MTRDNWPAIIILAVGIPALWVALWLTIGPPLDARHDSPVPNGYPTWHVDPPE